jgi:thiol-disulfide isomerase/thioredoxin
MRLATAILGALLCCAGSASAQIDVSAKSGFSPVELRFTRSLANIEYVSNELLAVQPKVLRVLPRSDSGLLWFGRIRRRLPGDPLGYAQHDVAFAAAYVNGHPSQLWCDQNLNGDLTDDAPVRLYAYPGLPGARAGLVDLRWAAPSENGPIAIHWKVRIVLEAQAPTASLPRYRQQMVYAMTGTLQVDGRNHRAFLYDGNSDGIYTKGFGDGFFVDLDDDGDVLVDPTTEEFMPFGVPAQLGGTLFLTEEIDTLGEHARIESKGGQEPLDRLRVGDPAPDFEFEALDGRTVKLSRYRGKPVLLYFWASWCGTCEERAPALRSLYDRFHGSGLEILSISFDHEREPMLAFVAKHREPWPVSYLGRRFWENPIGRLYGVSATGSAYLIDAKGNYVGPCGDLTRLAEDLPRYLPHGTSVPAAPNGLSTAEP